VLDLLAAADAILLPVTCSESWKPGSRWAGAATLDAGGRLLTFDAHFQHVPGLDCVLLS